MSILETLDSNFDLRAVPEELLPKLCCEIRELLIDSLSRTGGHLASNLGAVELTVALHRVYDPMRDRIVFDVGHQCYTHKLLTGRRERFSTLRQYGGISGFPKPEESEADAFIAGHASNSVSVALGMAKARTALGEHYDVVAVIGDGALTGGLAYEGLCGAGQSGEPMVVVLNDNAMSIDHNVGGMAKLLSELRVKPGYFEFKRRYRAVVGKVPRLYSFLHEVKEGIKDSILPDNMFDCMGFYYLGPVDGHNVPELEAALRWAREMRIPVLLHVITRKGKGYPWAEKQPEKYHGVGSFDPATGVLREGGRTYSDVFGTAMCELAEDDGRVRAVTAAMCDGTGLAEFAQKYPQRFSDAGIAEGHAVAMSAGMAKQGLIPVAAIYSSFLQRGYDMLIHDTALQGLHLVLGVDRAGLVGADGPTHHGAFDVAYLRSVPGMTIYAPASFAETRLYLRRAVLEETGPVAVRYPRGGEGSYRGCETEPTSLVRGGGDLTLVTYGATLSAALECAEILEKSGVSAEVVKISRLAPLDAAPILDSVARTGRVLIAEEVCAAGGMGEQVLSLLGGRVLFRSRTVNLGEGFQPQGSAKQLRALVGLDAESLARSAKELMNE